jgi:KDO2-lipid IV(A) lauroyltransferase
LIDFIAYIIVRALNKALSVVPISVTLWFGRRAGTLVFFINRKRRLVAYANLKAAFAKEKSPAELKLITKRVYQTMVQTFVEVLQLTKVNKKYVDKYVEVVNFRRIKDAAVSGRGTVLLTAHFGDWEMSSLVSSVKGFPIMVLAREQKMKRLNELLNRLRESNGCKVIRKGMDIKNLFKALYGKNIVGILSDQDAGRSGIFVDFFGRKTSCHAGPFEMAKRTGSLILPNFIVRQKGPYHKLYLEDYIDFENMSSSDDIKQGLQQSANLLESYVRKYPDQWLWLHKRWKSTPSRTVLVLNDGKAGHLNQSLAVAKAIQKARTTQGFDLDDTKIEIVDVRFKNSFARASLTVAAAYATWRCHGCMRCMRLALTAQCYDKLMSTYAEFVVSAGSGLAPVNVFMAKENSARNVIVMAPPFPITRLKFDLAIVPRHDDPPNCANVVITKMAPNLLGEKMPRPASDTLGALIGGDNPEYSLTGDISRAAVSAIKSFTASSGAGLSLTTSRRTPKAVEAIVKNALKGDARLRTLVIASENNPPDTVKNILSESRVVVVTEESISMISEAVSAGRKVVVLKLAKNRPGTSKHARSIAQLEREGYLSVCDAADLEASIRKAWNDNSPVAEVGDSEKIFAAVRRLI